MEKLKSSFKNMLLVLVGVCIVVGCLLAYANEVTKGPIEKKKQVQLEAGIRNVMGGESQITATDTVKQKSDGKVTVFVVHHISRDGQSIGAAVESATQGFGGTLKVLVGFDTEGKVLGYTILESSETPGLGARADKWFQKGAKGDIIGKNPNEKTLTVSKDGGDVDAITASTITSRAFLKAVDQACGAYLSKSVDGESGASQLSGKEHEDE